MRQANLCSTDQPSTSLSLPCTCAMCASAYGVRKRSSGEEVEREKRLGRKKITSPEREAMRVCLAPKARCIYLGNDSHLHRQGMCMSACVCNVPVCMFVLHKAQCSTGGCGGLISVWLTAWPRGWLADLFAGKNTTVSLVLLFSLLLLYSSRLAIPPFFIPPFPVFTSPESAFPPSIICPCYASKVAFINS